MAALRLLEDTLRVATEKQEMPLVLLAAADRGGNFEYHQAFGNCKPKASSPPANMDTMIRLASATKLTASIAAMQIVEQGLFDLDQDISDVLPEWKHPQLLEGFSDDGEPILRESKEKLTLRQLLSHNAGMAGMEGDMLFQYWAALNDPKPGLVKDVFQDQDPNLRRKALPGLQSIMGQLSVEPLSYEPGTSWEYSKGVDWAGRIVERLTSKTLEQYCQEHIFRPFGMLHTTFRPLKQSYGTSLLAEMSSFDSAGKIEPGFSIYSLDPQDDLGGVGLFSTCSDMMKILLSLLRNDGKLLRPETVNLMLDYRLPDTPQLRNFKTTSEEIEDNYRGLYPEGMSIDHCLAGLVNCADLNGGRKAGSVAWGGATGCFWWLDRTGGVCGFYGSQLMFLHDKERKNQRTFQQFEKAVYESIRSGSGS